MIGYSLTEEQEALQAMAREFAEKEMRPKAAKYDEGHEFQNP
jgi:alkylation response protein AidB-like acyl-CoA dehydrogenase